MILKKRNLALPVWVSFNTFQYFAFYISNTYFHYKTYSKKYFYRTSYIKLAYFVNYL